MHGLPMLRTQSLINVLGFRQWRKFSNAVVHPKDAKSFIVNPLGNRYQVSELDYLFMF